MKPPPLPVRKLPEPTKVSLLKPPPLPVRKPQQGPGVVGEEAAKFKAAQERAAKVGVENLTKKDIDGLSYEQIKELRGTSVLAKVLSARGAAAPGRACRCRNGSVDERHAACRRIRRRWRCGRR